MKDETRTELEKLGAIYWKDFFNGVKGNPWRVKPTVNMFTSYEIYGLSRSVNKGPCCQETEYREVFFDAAYCSAYFEKYEDVISVYREIHALAEKETTSIESVISDFEISGNISVSDTNPRHSLYRRFVDYAKNRKEE